MFMKTVGEEKSIGNKNTEEVLLSMERVFIQIGGKHLEPMNYPLEQISIFNLVQTAILKILFMEQMAIMQSNL